MAVGEQKIVVVGAGAVGGWIAARLALSGRDVAVVARGTTRSALESGGLILTEAGETRRAEVRICDEPGDFGEQNLVVIAVKAHALASAVRTIRPMIGPRSIILPMLNGVPWWFMQGRQLASVDPDGEIARLIPLDAVVGCVVHAACSRQAPNHVRVAHADRLILGEPGSGKSERVERLNSLFSEAGIRCDATAGIRQAIWYKLWGNATVNPLSALTRATADRLLADPALRAFMLDGMAELAAIGAAIGCPIAESGEDRLAVTARLGAFKPSMLQDVEAGRPIELDALVGAPIEIARLVGVATPNLDLLYAATRLLAEQLR